MKINRLDGLYSFESMCVYWSYWVQVLANILLSVMLCEDQ